MHLLVFGAAAVWITSLLALLVVYAIRTTSTAIRILAVDSLTLVLVALLALYSAANQEPYYLDAALAVALFAFIGTVVAARRLGSEQVL